MTSALSPASLSEELNSIFEHDGSVQAAEFRQAAIASFKKTGLPNARSEEYRFTPLTRQLEKNFKVTDFTKAQHSGITSVEQFIVPDLACNILVFLNGRYSPALSTILSPEDQLSVTILEPGMPEYQTKSSAETFSHDPFAALNSALWKSGIYLNVPDGKKADLPVFILHLDDSASSNVVSQTRLVTVVGKGSELCIIEKFCCVGSHAVFNSVVEEITINENAALHYHRIQIENEQMSHAGNTVIHQHRAASSIPSH